MRSCEGWVGLGAQVLQPGLAVSANRQLNRIRPQSHSPNCSTLTADDPVRVIAAVIHRGDRYLLCERPTHKRHGGLWEFPGGKLEPGESMLEAARRELSEELDVRVQSVQGVEFAINDPGSHFVIEFCRVEIDGEPACLEHRSIAWVTLGELLKLALAPSDRQFALHLSSRLGTSRA
jgi:mutator protein MutT